jgi:hypothetical protein
MPNERTPQKSASKRKLEAASARKTRAKLGAETDASGKICPDGLMGAAETAEEGSQIQPEPDPSGGCGGHAEVKIKAQTKATRDAAADHLLSDNHGSEDNSGVTESQGLVASPKGRASLIKSRPTETRVSGIFRLKYRHLLMIWRKKCFIGLRQTALLSAEGKNKWFTRDGEYSATGNY